MSSESNQDSAANWARNYVEFANKFKYILLVLAIVLAAGSLYYTKDNLRLNNDLASLLPENAPTILGLKESNKRFGATDKFMIAVQADDPVIIAKFQDSIKKIVDETWTDVMVRSQIKRDNQFFEDNALMYLPVIDLERIRDNLVTLQVEMGAKGNFMVVDLKSEEEKAKPKEDLVWFNANAPQELGLPDEAAAVFSQFFKEKEKKSPSDSAGLAGKLNAKPKKKKWDPKANIPDDLKSRLIGQDKSDSSFNGIVILKLNEPSTNLNFTQVILDKSEALLAPFRAAHPEVLFAVAGTYEGLKDVEEMASDGKLSTLISIIAIILFLIIFFRSIQAPIVLISQVAFAIIIMLFFTAMIYGQLNPFTLFVAAIIFGMGIDFSIHMMGNTQRIHSQKGNLVDALSETLSELIWPMGLAALTTVAGLLTLLIADFKGFYEFGIIASIGITLSLGTALFGLPVLLLITGGLPKKKAMTIFPASWSESQIMTFLSRGIRVLAVVTLVMAFFAPYAEFEHNMRNLRSEKKASIKKVRKVKTGVAETSNRKSSQPIAVLGDTQEELQKLHDSLMVRKHTQKDSYLRSWLTLSSFVPPADAQEERMEIIEEIDELINAKAFDKAKGEDLDMVTKLRGLVGVEEFTPEDIPAWALDLLKEKDGSYGKVGFIYGSFESWNARDVAKFQDAYGHWNFGGKDLRSFSSSFIFSDVIRLVKADSMKMGVFISLVLIMTLFITLRKFKLVLISFGTLALGCFITIGMMGVFNLTLGIGKIGIYNVIVIPTLLGVGIDAIIHLLVAFQQQKKKSLHKLYNNTGLMVIASSLTTGMGFFGVLFVSHRGMRTIGELAVLGILCTLMVSLILTPWLSKKFIKEDE